MLKQHKNALLESIKEAGLDPSAFRGEESKQAGRSGLLSFFRLLLAVDDAKEETVFSVSVKDSPLRFSVKNQDYSFTKFGLSTEPLCHLIQKSVGKRQTASPTF